MRRLPAPLCLPALALALSACASTVSTASFKGGQHNVAQTIANLQTDATAGEQKKICANDLAAAVVSRLGGTKRCEAAIKKQLTEIDSLTVSVQSVKLAAAGTSATAAVTSVYEGKKRPSSVSLVKEGGKWKISALG
jgi:sorbitol-specific phosphotransferase system component IIBC